VLRYWPEVLEAWNEELVDEEKEKEEVKEEEEKGLMWLSREETGLRGGDWVCWWVDGEDEGLGWSIWERLLDMLSADEDELVWYL